MKEVIKNHPILAGATIVVIIVVFIILGIVAWNHFKSKIIKGGGGPMEEGNHYLSYITSRSDQRGNNSEESNTMNICVPFHNPGIVGDYIVDMMSYFRYRYGELAGFPKYNILGEGQAKIIDWTGLTNLYVWAVKNEYTEKSKYRISLDTESFTYFVALDKTNIYLFKEYFKSCCNAVNTIISKYYDLFGIIHKQETTEEGVNRNIFFNNKENINIRNFENIFAILRILNLYILYSKPIWKLLGQEKTYDDTLKDIIPLITTSYEQIIIFMERNFNYFIEYTDEFVRYIVPKMSSIILEMDSDIISGLIPMIHSHITAFGDMSNPYNMVNGNDWWVIPFFTYIMGIDSLAEYAQILLDHIIESKSLQYIFRHITDNDLMCDKYVTRAFGQTFDYMFSYLLQNDNKHVYEKILRILSIVAYTGSSTRYKSAYDDLNLFKYIIEIIKNEKDETIQIPSILRFLGSINKSVISQYSYGFKDSIATVVEKTNIIDVCLNSNLYSYLSLKKEYKTLKKEPQEKIATLKSENSAAYNTLYDIIMILFSARENIYKIINTLSDFIYNSIQEILKPDNSLDTLDSLYNLVYEADENEAKYLNEMTLILFIVTFAFCNVDTFTAFREMLDELWEKVSKEFDKDITNALQSLSVFPFISMLVLNYKQKDLVAVLNYVYNNKLKNKEDAYILLSNIICLQYFIMEVQDEIIEKYKKYNQTQFEDNNEQSYLNGGTPLLFLREPGKFISSEPAISTVILRNDTHAYALGWHMNEQKYPKYAGKWKGVGLETYMVTLRCTVITLVQGEGEETTSEDTTTFDVFVCLKSGGWSCSNPNDVYTAPERQSHNTHIKKIVNECGKYAKELVGRIRNKEIEETEKFNYEPIDYHFSIYWGDVGWVYDNLNSMYGDSGKYVANTILLLSIAGGEISNHLIDSMVLYNVFHLPVAAASDSNSNSPKIFSTAFNFNSCIIDVKNNFHGIESNECSVNSINNEGIDTSESYDGFIEKIQGLLSPGQQLDLNSNPQLSFVKKKGIEEQTAKKLLESIALDREFNTTCVNIYATADYDAYQQKLRHVQQLLLCNQPLFPAMLLCMLSAYTIALRDDNIVLELGSHPEKSKSSLYPVNVTIYISMKCNGFVELIYQLIRPVCVYEQGVSSGYISFDNVDDVRARCIANINMFRVVAERCEANTNMLNELCFIKAVKSLSIFKNNEYAVTSNAGDLFTPSIYLDDDCDTAYESIVPSHMVPSDFSSVDKQCDANILFSRAEQCIQEICSEKIYKYLLSKL